LQFDLVGVSGTNQYKVMPLALVTTFTPLIVLVLRVAVVEAVPDAPADGAAELAAELTDGAADLAEFAGFDGDELPHPAARSTAAGIAAAAQYLRVRRLGSCSVSI
jgi:hypothetical protein